MLLRNRRLSSLFRVLAIGLGLLFAHAGCGGGAPKTENTPLQAAPSEPLTTNSTGGCSLDRDCAAGRYCFLGQCATACQTGADCPAGRSCTKRGRCIRPTRTARGALSADGVTREARAFADLEVVEAAKTRISVGRNQKTVTYELTLNQSTPEGGLPYRIDRSDDDEVTTNVEYIESQGKTLSFSIPVGKASPNAENSERVEAKLFSPLGNFTLTLLPEYPVSGTYEGTASFAIFGQSGLSIEFEVVTEPAGAPLAEATNAWLVLPVGAEHLLSPMAPSPTAPESVARKLKYVESRDYWLATFTGAYDLGGAEIVRIEDADQVQRSMRFELERLDEDTLTGEVADRWKGLYERKSDKEAPQPQTISFRGTVSVDRTGGARPSDEIRTRSLPEARPGALPAPAIDRCSKAEFFDVEDVEGKDGTVYTCETIGDADAFNGAPPPVQASCAVAVARRSLAGETTISRVEAYLNGQNSGQTSFAEFMKKCADTGNDICKPNPDVRCARQLVARAFDGQQPGSKHLDVLVTQYNESTRETYFGRQVAAFHADMTIRKDWLSSTVWPETFQGLKDLVGSMLEDWKRKVLEAHLDSLKGQFAPSAINILARQLDDEQAASTRKKLLVGMTQSWRGSIDALTLATKRWNLLFTSETKRRQKSDFVAGHILDLYLSGGLLNALNTDAGAGALSSRLAGGFDLLVDELERLSRSFSDLIYARDGEIAVSTSLDPTQDNESLLSKRRRAAITRITDADAEITSILEETRLKALSDQNLKTKWANRIDDTRAELLEMCGRPVGCQDVNYREGTPPEGCEIRWRAGRCGFKIDRDSDKVVSAAAGEQNSSQAGQILLEIVEAIKTVHIADAERDAHARRISLRYEALEAFSKDIEQRNQLRRQFITQLETNVKKRQNIRNQGVKNILESMEKSAKLHKKFVDESRRRFKKWEEMESQDSKELMGKLVKAENQRISARTLSYAADTASGLADVIASGVPDSGLDWFAGAESAAKAVGFTLNRELEGAAMGLRQSAGQVDLARARLQSRQQTEMTDLKRQFKIDKAKWKNEIARLRRQRQKKRQLTQNQVAKLKETINVARRYVEAELAHREELATFREKRRKVKEMLTKSAGLGLRVQRAKLQLTQVLERYRRIVQRARNTHAELEKLTKQSANINSLIGSPDALFAQANELQAAERELFAARQSLMNWLVALEYYAVRPFLDQRIQILLARNPYQLEKIKKELQTLENNCGSTRSTVDAVFSVREDLLGITQPSKDPVTGQTFTPAERFREVISRGYVPVDKRIRYSSDKNIGQLMARSPDILAGTFSIDLSDDANLQNTCNAKLKSVAINLVGEGMAEVRPTATLLYDGTSKLRSCQPGLSEHLTKIGAASATTYDTISRFNPPGQSTSPVATINGFGAEGGQKNKSLSGLPLASQYTVLINKKAGENPAIDWSKLEDIELRLEYTYQDFITGDRCQL